MQPSFCFSRYFPIVWYVQVVPGSAYHSLLPGYDIHHAPLWKKKRRKKMKKKKVTKVIERISHCIIPLPNTCFLAFSSRSAFFKSTLISIFIDSGALNKSKALGLIRSHEENMKWAIRWYIEREPRRALNEGNIFIHIYVFCNSNSSGEKMQNARLFTGQ